MMASDAIVNKSSSLESIKYEKGHLLVLDQLLLPNKCVYVNVSSIQEAWHVIKKMQVRGAPAIAVVGCLSLAVEISKREFFTCREMGDWVLEQSEYLRTARPTAVNLKTATDELANLVAKLQKEPNITPAEMKKRITDLIESMIEKDIEDNRSIGRRGAEALIERWGDKQEKLNVVTHCNTGSLATAGYGTALGVIRALHSRGRLEQAFCTETRPYLQGARLTAYEMVHDDIPSTLITDSMVASLMTTRDIHGIIVGADRIAGNGDTANKIGTLQLAITALHYKVPFYVAAPTTSIDVYLSDGGGIPVEERPARELTHIRDHAFAPQGIGVWNPAFDITPAKLITGGVITEKGVFKANELRKNLLQTS